MTWLDILVTFVGAPVGICAVITIVVLATATNTVPEGIRDAAVRSAVSEPVAPADDDSPRPASSETDA
jgi:Na+/citrate or Na+/malate symporter